MTQQTESLKSPGLGDTVLTFPGKSKAPKPDTDIEPQAHRINLLSHLPDCMFKRYVKDVAKMCWLPENSVLFVGLGVVSSVASRAYAIGYKHRGTLPLGEYIICCNPPGVPKSRCLSTFQHPIFTTQKAAYREWKEQHPEPDNNTPDPPPIIFGTDATPEGIDQDLSGSNGFFSLASAEQAVINTITGASYTKEKGSKNNNKRV